MSDDVNPLTPSALSATAAQGERLVALQPRLRLLLGHLTGPSIRRRVEIDDLVQEVFVRALTASTGLPEFEPRDVALARLLQRIARNTVVDAARAVRAAKRDGRTERLERSTWSQAPGHTPAALGAGPFTLAVGRENEARLERAYHTLSSEHRRVIGLRQFEGLSAATAATRMGRTETAVHSLYRRALDAWHGALEAKAQENPESCDESRTA